ncbi:DUF1614 domain-containing protein [Synechococcus sp. R50.1]|jgi:uncharacterized membrane protein|uniref:DUF1614 domain-containing protein n=1 Tax=Synechococcus sp. R50.1 TaxID=2969649 RepID=UPI0039C053E0
MFYLPVSLLLFFMLVLLLPFLWLGLAVDVVALAVGKLGFSREGALLLLLAILVGSSVNIPLYRVKCEVTLVEDLASLWMRQFWGIPLTKLSQETVIALNVGGGLIPVLLALYQFGRADSVLILAVTALVTLVSYYASHVVPGKGLRPAGAIGIQMNPLIAPATAALAALFWAGDQAPAVAFAGGVLGTLIGADLLHLPEVLRRNCSGILSIGGAGVFDGIALCGLFALLLS